MQARTNRRLRALELVERARFEAYLRSLSDTELDALVAHMRDENPAQWATLEAMSDKELEVNYARA